MTSKDRQESRVVAPQQSNTLPMESNHAGRNSKLLDHFQHYSRPLDLVQRTRLCDAKALLAMRMHSSIHTRTWLHSGIYERDSDGSDEVDHGIVLRMEQLTARKAARLTWLFSLLIIGVIVFQLFPLEDGMNQSCSDKDLTCAFNVPNLSQSIPSSSALFKWPGVSTDHNKSKKNGWQYLTQDNKHVQHDWLLWRAELEPLLKLLYSSVESAREKQSTGGDPLSENWHNVLTGRAPLPRLGSWYALAGLNRSL